ncbi:MAG: phage tail family protein [Negativicutes bacterium]|nr:phage tail family protein [Negativicutes bacterium]
MFIKKGSTIYTLPDYAVLNGLSLSIRSNVAAKLFQHGGLPSGDGKVDTRSIDIAVLVNGENQSDYLSQVNDLKRYLSQSPYRLYVTDTQYFNIDILNKFKEDFISGFYMVKSNATATILALDPFLYDEEELSVSTTVTTSPQVFTINNPGNIDTPITITITANALNSALSLINTSDNGRVFTYNDASFTSGKSLVISTWDGSVELNGANSINNFLGTFMNLLPGDNVFSYTGSACTITMDYLSRWL